VAVKLLPFAAVLDARQIARFKNEAQAAAQVQHPNIVPVFAIGVERGVHYYAMQLIDGRPLDQAISELREGAERTPAVAQETVNNRHASTRDSLLNRAWANREKYYRTVVQLGLQAAEALHAAHEYGVVHRDVKPSNLLLDAQGKLWVTDFGLARCQRDVSLTKSGDLVGTMRYMSPEQAAGRSALVDHRTDVYSLGVTLYELVCLRPAFAGEDGAALLRQIDQHEPPPPREVRPDIPPDLETVILKAMAKHRDERYATASLLADDLRCILQGRPTMARPPSVADRLGKWARRHRRMLVAAAALLAVAAVAQSAATVMISREKARAEQSLARAERYFRNTRDVLDRFGLQLSERLADVPGAEPVRQELLTETRRYYHDFAEDAKDDPSLRVDLALTYSKVARLTDQIGSTAQAVAEHEKALALFEELAQSEPDNLDHQRHLASCRVNLALALARTGRTDEALKQLAAAISSQERLAAQAPGDERSLADLAMSFSNQGLVQNETGKAAEAQASYAASIGLLKQLREARPDDPERRLNLAAAYNNLAATKLDRQPEEAAALHDQALEHQRAAAQARPDDLSARRSVALTLNNLGAAYSRTKQVDDARRRYEQAISVQEELVRVAPAQRAFAGDLAVSHNNLGLIQQRGGRPEEAERAFRRAIRLQEPLAAQSPDDVAVRSSLGGIYNNLGVVLEQADRLADAADAFEQAIDHQRQAHAQAAEVSQFRRFLGTHYNNYDRVLRRLGRTDEAARAALARRELLHDEPETIEVSQ
jgi:tetratricopeptide (TPR) repeat protein/tRNA A-37 threonylcarbamoyl transferase component Bud32